MQYGYLAAMAIMLTSGCSFIPAGRTIGTSDKTVTTGAVGVNDITDDVKQNNRLTIAANESFIPPLEDEHNTIPEYPQHLLGKNVPVQILCVQLAIDGTGHVTVVLPIAQPPQCPGLDTIEPEIVEDVKRVAGGWRFEPGLRCVFPDLKTKETTYGSCGDAKAIPQSVSLTYRFVFEQNNGHGVVRMGQSR